jgi:HTH-type transcriptional regulator/antitoxin MqsA
VFHPHGQTLVIPLLTSVCEHCGAEATSSAQHDENLRRLAERKAHYGGLLLGEDILALRRHYGLTQQLASRIFGKGKIAFSRYESETTYPDASTTLLISLAIAQPDALKWLADQAGVEILLWQARYEDAQCAAVACNTQEIKAAASKSVAAAAAPAAPAKRRARVRSKAQENALP